MTEPTTVVVVEDHPLVASGIAALLDVEDDLAVVACCGSIRDAVRAVDEHRPDVVLLDERLPDGRGSANVGRLIASSPACRVLVVSAEPEAVLVRDALAAGCAGVLSKSGSATDLVRAVRSVAAGGVWFSADVLAGAVVRLAGRPDARLTRREVEVLRLLAEDLAKAEIARRLHLSANTVGNHVQNLYAKLGVRTRLGAVLAGVRDGAVLLPDVSAE